MKLKRIIISLVVSLLAPIPVAVAEPSFGSFGFDAISAQAVLTAKPSFDRFTGRTLRVQMSAYNAVIAQTDDRPWETADGSDLREPSNRNTVATNDLALGTRVIFPTIDPGTVYVVRDRMNERYTGKGVVDLFMGMDIAGARQFGRRNNVEMIVLD